MKMVNKKIIFPAQFLSIRLTSLWSFTAASSFIPGRFTSGEFSMNVLQKSLLNSMSTLPMSRRSVTGMVSSI